MKKGSPLRGALLFELALVIFGIRTTLPLPTLMGDTSMRNALKFQVSTIRLGYEPGHL
jgi:hypothetical protein